MNTDIFAFGQDPIWNVLIRFLITLLVLFIVIRLIYFRHTKREGYVFSFFMMGIMIFLVCILLKTVEIQLGIALGLFAIFAILRFRSSNLSIRSMTYFFTVIGIAVINAMATFYNPVRGTILVNSIIIISLLVLEGFFHKESLNELQLTYDKLELLNPDMLNDLLRDISLRTGKKIEKVRIRKIDLIKGNAELDVFYRDAGAMNS
jgi:uncharacterized membrane protein